MKIPTTLITGAAGFLGSHLCDKFLSLGHSVIGMDNFITGNPKNIAHLKDNSNFKFIQQDITEYIDIDVPVDYILHFASPASPIDYLKIPILTMKVSSLGTLNLLGLAKVKKARILLASTSEIYGDPLQHPQKETYAGNVDTIKPRGVYDEAKRFMESLAMAYKRAHGVDVRIARIFNTYGPRMRLNDGRVVPAFIGQILRGENITLFGDGSQTRSFCYVEDEIEGFVKLLFSDYSLPVNIGNPDEISIKEFSEILQDVMGVTSSLIYEDLPIGDPKLRRPDITLANNLLGWSPKINIREGLSRTVDYFKTLTSEELNLVEHKEFNKYTK